MAFGAEMNTEMTLLAQFFFYLNISFHILSPIRFYLEFNSFWRMLSVP